MFYWIVGSFMLIFLLAFFGIIVIFLIKENNDYKNTEYFKEIKISFLKLLKDTGKYGEYLIYKKLSLIEGSNKFLFNVYVPKEDGTTTEIDVIMLNKKGIFLFESKNYSGWIFGKETDQMWTQTLKNENKRVKKFRFFNPIIQNNVHLKWIKEYLNEYENISYYSYIVFSERCELKNVTLTTDKHKVVKRENLLNVLNNHIQSENIVDCLSEDMINEIYNKLYKLTKVDDLHKQQHINKIEEKYNKVKKSDISSMENKDVEKICPKCGSKLVKRVAKRGEHIGNEFYGCENYPKCRHIENI